MAEVALTSNAGFQIIDVAFALEALDKVYIRSTRAGMKFIMSYVEETELTNDTALGGLVDVDTNGVTDGQSLAYNLSSLQWEPTTITGGGGGGATTLDGLTDVSIAAAATGDFLLHNGTAFVDQNFASQVASNATVFGHTTKLSHVSVTQAVDLDTMESDIATNSAKTSYTAAAAVALNTAKVSYDDAAAVALNTAKTSYTDSAAVALNTAKVTYDDSAAVALNTAKVTYDDAAAVALNTAKVTYDDAAAVALNTAKVTYDDAGAVALNTAKVSYDGAAAVALNTAKVSYDGAAAVALNTAKVTYDDAAAVALNTAKVSYDDAAAVALNTAKVSYTDAAVDTRIGVAKIEDLDEVSSTAPSTGQVLKWNGSEWAPAADNSSTGGAGGVVDSVNGISAAAVVLDPDDLDDAATTHKFATAAELTKVGHLSVTQAVNLDTMETNIATNNGKVSYTDSAAVVLNTAKVSYTGAAAVALNTAKDTYPSADATKMGFISVSQAVNLDTMETTIGTNTSAANTAAIAAITAQNSLSTHSSSLDGHADVTFTYTGLNRPDGAHLVWDQDHWGEEVTSISNLSDVDVTTTAPTTGQFLKWDGTNWVPDTVTTGGSVNVTIDANTTPTSAGDYNDGATIMNLTTVSTAVAAGRPYYLGSAGWTNATNGDATASSNVIAMCTSDSTTGSSMLLEGVVKYFDNLTGAVGDKVYLHTGAKLTMTEPTSSATVREMGVLLDATNNIIYFKPSDVSLTIQ